MLEFGRSYVFIRRLVVIWFQLISSLLTRGPAVGINKVHHRGKASYGIVPDGSQKITGHCSLMCQIKIKRNKRNGICHLGVTRLSERRVGMTLMLSYLEVFTCTCMEVIAILAIDQIEFSSFWNPVNRALSEITKQKLFITISQEEREGERFRRKKMDDKHLITQKA